jgi:hypothetical protein
MDLRVSSDDEEPGRVAVEPVDDAGALRLLAARDSPSQEAVDECSGRMPGGRMDDEPHGFFDHEQVLVLVRDLNVELLRLETGRAAFREIHPKRLATHQSVTLGAGYAVHENPSLGDEPLGFCARADLRDVSENSVESFAGRRRRNFGVHYGVLRVARP